MEHNIQSLVAEKAALEKELKSQRREKASADHNTQGNR